MGSEPRRLDPAAARREAERLGAAGAPDWPPGETWASAAPGALVRVGEPEPGEGLHREHVRLLHGAGEAAALAALLAHVVAALPERLRLEARAVPGLDDGWLAALEPAGLASEGRLPRGWRAGPGDERDLLLFGRPPARRREPPAFAAPPAPAGRPSAEPELFVHGPETRRELAAFLDSLIPGRSYPAGALLSEAERAEGRRRRDLEADWVLAAAEGRVVGGVVLEPDGRAERAHVRRLHVDVAPPWRGRGLASRLLVRARAHAAQLGASRVEADPRGGHAVVRRALEAARLETCAVQRAAWRMRTASASWDEDVVLLSAPAG